MPDAGYLAAAVGVSAAVTWALRAAPFGLLAPLRASRVVGYLGAHLPLGVLVILVGYSLRQVPFTVPPYGAPTLLALTATLLLHRWRRNVILSIFGGTVVSAVLASVVF